MRVPARKCCGVASHGDVHPCSGEFGYRGGQGTAKAGKVAMKTGLEIRHLTSAIIDVADIAVRPGAPVALVGRSGSGKSSLMRAIVDLDRNEGEIMLHGVSRSDMSAPLWRQAVVHVPAEPGWWGRLLDKSLGKQRYVSTNWDLWKDEDDEAPVPDAVPAVSHWQVSEHPSLAVELPSGLKAQFDPLDVRRA